MNGKIVVGTMLIIAAVMGAGLWYAQTFGWYREVSGITQIVAEGRMRDISDYRGIDGESSPLKLRGCFRADWGVTGEDPATTEADPLVAPRWFDCFDAEQINADIRSGAASVVTSRINDPYGFTTYIALYTDGRGYLWRQINACGAAAFAGEDLPEGCEEAQVGTAEPDQASLPPQPTGDTSATAAPQAPTAVAPTLQAGTAPQLAPVATDDESPAPAVAAAPPATPIDRAAIENLALILVASGLPEPLRTEALVSDAGTACLSTPLSFGLLTETFELADPVEVPSSTQTCFNPDQIALDIDIGNALLLPARANGNRAAYIAVYGDGQSFAWLADE